MCIYIYEYIYIYLVVSFFTEALYIYIYMLFYVISTTTFGRAETAEARRRDVKKLARPIWLAVCQRVKPCFPFS